MKRHMSASVDGMLAWRKKLHHILQDENGKLLNDAEARAYLRECQEKGIKKIPCGDCDNFDPVKGCMGHPSENEKSDGHE